MRMVAIPAVQRKQPAPDHTPEATQPPSSSRWSTSTRHDTLPPDWTRTRQRILRRDNYRCTQQTDSGRCTTRANQVHHIGRPDDHDDNNLTSLCQPHHATHSAAEGQQAMRERRASAKHPTETHPALRN